jgi:phage terminase large subunit GpA-like protein
MLDTPYADADALFSSALDMLLPPSRDTVDEFAAMHRRIPRRTGTGFELWSNETAPYLAAPMRALTSYQHLTTCVVAPAGTGKTAIAENGFLHAVAKQPRNILWYMQTKETLEAYVKDRLDAMILEQKEEMYDRLGKRPKDDTLKFKRFVGMTTQLLPANYNNLISKRAPVIILDEVDAFDPTLGDVKTKADDRRARFGFLSMLLAMSHADLATGNAPKDWGAGIMRIYKDSTRGIWVWPCAECGRWSSPVPFARRAMLLTWKPDDALDDIKRDAHLLCPINGCKIRSDQAIHEMNLAAYRHPGLDLGYLHLGQEISEDGVVEGEIVRSLTKGYFIVGPMSPFKLDGIGDIAREMAKAEREYEVSGDEATLKDVTVKKCGYLYSSKGGVGTVDAETLAERALAETQPLGSVPEGVRFLTCWIDVQIAHFEVLVRGFGVKGESWIVAKRRVPADTQTDGEAWEKLLTALITERFPLLADPSRGMALRCLGYDSQGAPGTSERAYEAWRRLRKDSPSRITFYGNAYGRDVYSVIPTRGAPNEKAPRLMVAYPDNQKKDKKSALRGDVPLAQFNANGFKDALAGQLRRMEPGEGYVHFPAALRSTESPHVVFEQVVSEVRDINGRWTKPHQGVRNEMLDLMVGTHVLAHLHGLARTNWASPPAWFAEHDKNSMIGPMTAVNADDVVAVQESPRRTIGQTLKSKK